MSHLIKRVCYTLRGTDGCYVEGIHRAVLATVPSLNKLPQPTLVPYRQDVPQIVDLMPSEYFRRGSLYEGPGRRQVVFDRHTLVVLELGINIQTLDWLLQEEIPFLCMELSDHERAPQGSNVWYRCCKVFTWRDRLVELGSFQLVPSFAVTGVRALDWAAEA